MKKLVIIMIILVIIFVGMITYKKIEKSNTISIEEIENIENYLNQIYLWSEVTKEALPCFDDINQADETWIWEVVNKNIEEDKPSYEQIQEKAQELFGEDFIKNFPKDGKPVFNYQEENNQYEAIKPELDEQGDLFLLNKIEKLKDGYEVEIVEYLEDYAPMLKEEPQNYIIIRNLKKEEIGRISGSSQEEETRLVKNNINQFSKKNIVLKMEKEKLYIQKVYE